MKKCIPILLPLIFISFFVAGCSKKTKVDKTTPETNIAKSDKTSPETNTKETDKTSPETNTTGADKTSPKPNTTEADKSTPVTNPINSEEAGAEALINEFIAKLYTVDNYKSIDLDSLIPTFPNDMYTNELKKVAGENALVGIINDRSLLMYITTCVNSHINIKITSTKINKGSSGNDGSVIFNYITKLQLTFPDENKQVEEQVYGQVTLKISGGTWMFTQVNKTDSESISVKYRKKVN